MAEGGAKGGAVALVAVGVAVLAGAIWWVMGQGGPPAQVGTEAASGGATGVASGVPSEVPSGAAPEVAPAATPAPNLAPDPLPAPAPPRFDVVRVDGAGLATIAGTAPAGATLSLRLDGAEIATAEADGAGQFAALVTLPPAEMPRLLGLVARLADGSELAGAETVAIGPFAAPVAAAEAVAVAPPPALLLSDLGATVLQAPALPEAPASGDLTALTIDAISYGAGGEVLLSGRAAPGAALRLYIDDLPVAEVEAGTAGRWQVSLTEVAPGLHRLRADALDAGGKVLARFETPFQRELPVAAAPPAPAATAADPAPVAAPAPITITVQPGLTLWAIARENFGEGVMYVQVFEANRDKIKDPDLIYPGQVFTVPKP